jgi:hypothetical protein
MFKDFDDMPEDFKDNEEEKVMLENKILRANKSMR